MKLHLLALLCKGGKGRPPNGGTCLCHTGKTIQPPDSGRDVFSSTTIKDQDHDELFYMVRLKKKC